MDWKQVGRLIAPFAPAAGSILGGFIPIPGAAFVLEGFGKVIARQFGVPETAGAQGVYDKLKELMEQNRHTEVIAGINAATERARIEVQGFVDVEKAHLHAIEVGMSQVGATMRAEQETLRAGKESFYFNGWRAACGWELVFFFAWFGGILMVALMMAAFFGRSGPLAEIKEAWPILAVFFAALGAVVGVYIVARSAIQSKAVEQGVLPASLGGKPPPAKPETVVNAGTGNAASGFLQKINKGPAPAAPDRHAAV